MNRCVLFFILCLHVFFTYAQKNITLESIYQNGKYKPEYAPSLIVSKDHHSYLEQFQTEKGSYGMVRKGIASGNLIDTLWTILPQSNEPDEIDDAIPSKDESRWLLISSTKLIYRYSTQSVVHVFDRASKKINVIHEGKLVMYPSFSPLGDKVAYIYLNNIYVYDVAKETTKQLTFDGKTNEIINGFSDWVYEEEFELLQAYEWSKDGASIAYVSFDEREVPQYSMQVWGDSLYPSLYTFKYPKAGQKNASVYASVVNVETGTIQVILDERGKNTYLPRIQWTNTQNIVAIQRFNRLQNTFEILHVHAQSKEATIEYSESDSSYVELPIFWRYAGDAMLLSSEKSGYRHLYSIRDGKAFSITSGKWEITEVFGLDAKQEWIYYSSTQQSSIESHVYKSNILTSDQIRLSKLAGTHSIEMDEESNYYVDTHSSVGKPPVTSICSKEDGKAIRMLESNELLAQKVVDSNLSPIEWFEISTANDTKLNAYMIKPKQFKKTKKYPVLMYVYGGPGVQTVQNEWGGNQSMWFQYLAQQGYIIVSVDGRGTGGKGAAFRKCTYGNLGALEVEDVAYTANYVRSLSYVDGARVGIWGWSFGGYLTSLALVKYPDLFKMGIAVAPVTDWRFYDSIYTERYLKTPEQNQQGYAANSPINYADKLKAHYLLIHGSGDDNVHIQHTIAMQKALIKAGKSFDTFIYPDKNHSIYGGNTRYYLFRQMTQYILEKL